MKSENANNTTLNYNNIPEGWEKVKLRECVTSNKNNIGKDYLYPVILYLDTGSVTEGKIEGFIQKVPEQWLMFYPVWSDLQDERK